VSEWLAWQIVDSTFPTGAFAHSWGLEAAWHQGEISGIDELRAFVRTSIQQTAFSTLPLVNAVYRTPGRLEELDVLAQAFLTNVVVNRASRVQGRTLIATAARIWPSAALADLTARSATTWAHVAPLSGATFRALGLSLAMTQGIVLYGAARGILSAAVRLGVVGSYEAQRLQFDCGPWLDTIAARCRDFEEQDLAQTAPILDLLQAGHDRLYSRLFQS